MVRFCFLPLLLLTLAVCARSALPAPASLPVGVARVDITPSYPVRLSGFGFRRTESEGITQRIWAKALAVGDDKQGPAVLLTVDNLGVPEALVRELAARLRKKAGVRRERLAVTATHTHTAPMLTGVAPTLFGQPIPNKHQRHIDRYTRELTDKLEQAALAALKDRRPARLAWAFGKVTFARNRRTRGGPVDHDLPVLVVQDLKGKVRAVYVSYACHCVTLSNNKVSGDWAGYAQEAIERLYPGAVALVSVGCGGDSNPSSGVTGDKVDVARKQGEQIAAEVKRLLRGKLTPLTGPLTTQLARLTLPFDKLPTRAQWQERVKQGGAVGYHAKVQLARLDRGEKLATHIDYPVQTWTFGDQLAVVFLPGEAVVDYALRLKRELDRRRLWVNAYANDAPCYIPSERVLKEGGYEGGGAMVYYDRPTRLKPGLEDKIVGEVRRQLGDRFQAPRRFSSPPLSPKESLACLRTTGKLEVQLVAAEPLVESPVAIDFGPDGRLWVAEMRDYPLGMDGKYKPGGRIKVLESSKGDGVYDKATVFLDNIPFPTGVTVWRKGVLVCAAPDILYAEDTKGTGKADVVRKLFSGFATHNYQARVNSLRYGLDNWVYGSSGIFGGKVKSFSGKTADLRGRDFRCRPDTGAIEPVSGLTQQGRVRDDWGDWFGCDSGTLIRHYPLADHYLARNPHVLSPAPHVLVPDDPDPNQLYPATGKLQLFKLSGPPNRVTSACGLSLYRDELLGKEYAGNSFTCEPVNLVVHRRVLTPRGVTFAGRRAPGEAKAEFLASTDGWFRPVEVRTGPDGALWVVDMYRYVIEHPRWIPAEDLARLDVRAGANRGRIYRVFPRGHKPRPVKRLDRLDTAGLVAALDSPNGTQRDLAQQLLLWKKDKSAVGPLQQLAAECKRPVARLHALCTLDGLGALPADLLTRALADAHPGVRRHAVRLCEPRLGRSPALARALLRRVEDADPQVRMQLAYTLGDWRDPRAAGALAALAVKDHQDPYRLAAVFSSLHKDNVGAVLTGVLASGSAAPVRDKVVPQLLALATALGDKKVLARVVEEVVTPGKGKPAAWQMAALADVLDALGRRKQSLEDVLDRAQRDRVHKLMDQARATVAAKAAEADRLAAVRLLGRQSGRRGADIRLLGKLLAPQQSNAVQAAAVAALARLVDRGAARALLDRWPGFSPSLRDQVLDGLLSRPAWLPDLLTALEKGTVKAAHVGATRRERLLRHADAEVRRRAEKVLGATATDRARVLAAYKGVLTLKGELGRGRKVFAKSCAACHRVESAGHAVGPDLAALTVRSPQALLVAILDPNRAIEARFITYQAVTKAGRVFNGILAAETATSITLKEQEGKQHVLLRADLAELTSTGLSLMPEGLEKDLSKQDLADLMAYVAGIQRPKQFPGNSPQVVTPDKDGKLRLSARRAAIYGKEIAFEQPFRNVGFWHGEHDHVVWQVRLKKPGRYDVYLDYACHPDSAGNAYLLDSDPPLKGKVASTGGWDRYRRQKIGTIALPAGESALTFRPDGKLTRRALFDLRGLELVPAGKGSK
jgi:putative membrane-bound dehydrogenase-like protein